MNLGYPALLESITRLRGVRGAMIITGSDGVVVAESLMEGVKGPTVAALAASLAGRLGRVTDGAGRGSPRFFQLEADEGSLFVAPGPDDLLLVALTDRDVEVGLARLELLRVAERLP